MAGEPFYNPPMASTEPGAPTLRDEFAGRVVAGMMTRMDDEVIEDIANGTRAGGPIARVAYTIADAMLRERAAER